MGGLATNPGQGMTMETAAWWEILLDGLVAVLLLLWFRPGIRAAM